MSSGNAAGIGIVGAAGRMGTMLLRQILGPDNAGATLAGATVRASNAIAGKDAGTVAGLSAAGTIIGTDPDALFAASDVVIDFTLPEALHGHLDLAAKHKTALVIGTTGLNPDQLKAIETASKTVPIVFAPNMSVGVVLLTALVEQAAAKLGPDAFDIEIFEFHHGRKIDAPSGTAVGLGQAAAAGRGVALDAVGVYGRNGHTGARPKGAIGFASLRGGDVVGDHIVTFAGEGERIELNHRASSRQIYATGAVRAAKWLIGRPAGLYSMRDVLGL